MDLREPVLECRQGLDLAAAGDHVFALGVDQEIAVRTRVAGGRIVGEPHAGTRIVVAISELKAWSPLPSPDLGDLLASR